MKQNQIKVKVQEINTKLEENEKLESKYAEEIKARMMKIPNIMDPICSYWKR